MEEIKSDLHWLMFWCFTLGFISCLAIWINVVKMKSNCKHKNTILRTIYSSINCETTAVFCQNCAKQLTEAKTDCR